MPTYAQLTISASRMPAGSIRVILRSVSSSRLGAAVPNDASGVVPWLSSFLDQPDKQDYVAKLRRQDADERHLFLLVGEAAPFDVQHALSRPGPSPDHAFALPDGLTHLWLASRYSSGSGIVVWLFESNHWQARNFPADH